MGAGGGEGQGWQLPTGCGALPGFLLHHGNSASDTLQEAGGGGLAPAPEPGACPPRLRAACGTAFQRAQSASLKSLNPALHPATDCPPNLGNALSSQGPGP